MRGLAIGRQFWSSRTISFGLLHHFRLGLLRRFLRRMNLDSKDRAAVAGFVKPAIEDMNFPVMLDAHLPIGRRNEVEIFVHIINRPHTTYRHREGPGPSPWSALNVSPWSALNRLD